MSNSNEWQDIKATSLLIVSWTITGILDTLFLILWVVSQYGVSRVINVLELNLFDRFVFYIFQFLFAVSSLSPVAITIYRDVRVMVIRTQGTIRREINSSKANESDESQQL